MGVLEFISLLAIYLEMAVLALFEYRMWKTMYTPLNLLMLPYAVMLMVTVLSSGTMGIVEFYYPSILIWMIGFLLFAIPSYMLALPLRNKLKDAKVGLILDDINMKYLNVFSVLLVIAFLLRFIYMAKTSGLLPGSDDFGYEYCGKGVWGHLHRALHALSIIYIYKFDKKHWWYLPLVFGMYFVTLMYGVKSWVLIPAMGAVCMRLYAGKMKLSLSLFLRVFVLAFAVFLVTYSFSLILGKEDSAAFGIVFEIICRNFVHYVISGIMGWSQDLQMGILETPNFDVLLTNVLNIYNAIIGNEYVNPINPHFIFNGVNGSNVRAFFGTIYVNCTIFQYVLVVVVVSLIHYLVNLWAIVSRNFYVNVIYFFYGGMLLMGWFEIYFYHLQFLEVPAWIMILSFLGSVKSSKTASATETNNDAIKQ